MKQLTVMTIEGQKHLIDVDEYTTNRSLLQTVARAINSPTDAVSTVLLGKLCMPVLCRLPRCVAADTLQKLHCQIIYNTSTTF
jgi:hypothetical protein